jgi:hypothetical protein
MTISLDEGWLPRAARGALIALGLAITVLTQPAQAQSPRATSDASVAPPSWIADWLDYPLPSKMVKVMAFTPDGYKAYPELIVADPNYEWKYTIAPREGWDGHIIVDWGQEKILVRVADNSLGMIPPGQPIQWEVFVPAERGAPGTMIYFILNQPTRG